MEVKHYLPAYGGNFADDRDEGDADPDFELLSEVVRDDGFSSLFDNQTDHRVDVTRISPEEYKGDLVKGYCGKLGPGDTLETIRQRYGGGKFKLNKRSNTTGKILLTATVDVAGAPVVVTPSTDPPSASPEASRSGSTMTSIAPIAPVQIDVAGTKLTLPASMADQFQYMQNVILWTKAVAMLFPAPADPNMELLSLFLKGRNDTSNDPIEVLLKLRTAFPDLFERSDVGSANWISVIQEAIKQAGGVLSAMSTARQPVRALPSVVRASSMPQLSAPKTEPVTATDSEPAAEPAAEMEPILNPQPTAWQIGLAMLAEIVKAFRLEPPKEETRVVALLDQCFQLDADRRQILLAFRETGFDWCEGQLEDVFAEAPGQRGEFRRYYEQIFTEYTRADREARFVA
jgi:hypothetical protein